MLVLGAAVLIYRAGWYPPDSLLHLSRFSRNYLLINFVASTFGVFSVIYQHVMYSHLFRTAYTDHLTGIPNRARLEIELQQRMMAPERLHAFSLVGIKLRHLSKINAFHGSDVGDAVLIETTRRIREQCQDNDLVVRYSGTLFVVLTPDIDSTSLQSGIRHVLGSIQRLQVQHGVRLEITAQVAITRYPEDSLVADQLISNLTETLSRNPRTQILFFDQGRHLEEQRRFAMAQELRQALIRDELHLVYHPKVRMHDGVACGCEVLLRWRSSTLGTVPPEVFIPLAEEVGLIEDITAWILHQVLKACHELHPELVRSVCPHRFAINLSPLDLTHPEFQQRLSDIARDHPQCMPMLEFEITEGIMMDDNPVLQQNLDALHEAGCRIAIDDFGTGYSNLGYLHRIRAQNLKIDRSFVCTLNETNQHSPIVEAILAMARSLQLDITAEGVETPFQHDFLIQRGCTYAQGWLYSKPLQLTDYKAWLTRNPNNLRS